MTQIKQQLQLYNTQTNSVERSKIMRAVDYHIEETCKRLFVFSSSPLKS